jgi:hypothetical protein
MGPSIWSGAPDLAVPGFFVAHFRVPLFLLPVYESASARYGVPWAVLAAINEIETDYGRNVRASSAGALGWMQFLPSTWQRYGVDANRDGVADPANPVDAIFTAARYLRAAGAGQDLSAAIFAYNHAQWYVDSVLARAQAIAGVPDTVVDPLIGLAQGRLPVAGHATYTRTTSGARILASVGAGVVAVDDGRLVGVGRTRRLGRFVRLRDAYGNTYTYAGLQRPSAGAPARRTAKLRLLAHGGHDIRFTKLRPGMRVAAGTILGRVGRPNGASRPQVVFRIRPAGHSAPLIDPTPILQSRRTLLAVGPLPSLHPRAYQVSTKGIASRVLADPRIHIYACGREDIRSGAIDPRVLATLELLAKWHLDPTVSSLKCGHGLMTTSGNVSEHASGSAVDIAAINGTPILGHQGPGSITDVVVRRLLTLSGEMAPHQIITLMRVAGADATLAMGDHADHIHVGWHPHGGTGGAMRSLLAQAALNREQWTQLVARLRRLAGPGRD